MRKSPVILALLFLFSLAGNSLHAQQFRQSLRTANNQYDLHAYNLAIQSYLTALERRPNDVEALSKIADSYRHLNQMVKANEYYTRAVGQRRVSAETRLEHAHVLKALGKYDQAKEWYRFYAREHDAVVGDHYTQSCDYAMQQAGGNSGFQAVSSSANSPSADFGPSFASANQLVFNSARTDLSGNFDGTSSNRPFVSVVNPSGDLQAPFPLRNGYSAQATNVGPCSYSPGGREVIFTRNNFTDGTRMIPGSGENLTLFIADVTPEGQWTNPRPLPFNVSSANSGWGSFSPDGNYIYFASNREEGYGGYDIYRAERQGNSWVSVPENMGTVINSMGDEITPAFDGISLFFASDWHFGMGGFDVFRAELLNGRASQIFHMGVPINSSRDDYGMVYNASRGLGYVVSNRIGGKGNEDIYRVSRANAGTTLLVVQAGTNQPVAGAQVDLRGCGDQVYQTDASGRFSLNLAANTNCMIVVSGAGMGQVNLSSSDLQANSGSEVVVQLGASGNAYLGQIVAGSTRAPIAGATIQVANRATGATESLVTDGLGNYQAALQPFTTYDINISAPGYEPLSFPITVDDGSDPNLLGQIPLIDDQNLPNPGPNIGGGGGTTTVTSGYSVQLASLNKAAELNRFSNLSDLGRVYQTESNGSYKLKLGIFQTRAEADAAKAAARTRGYNGAFVVEDKAVTQGNGLSGSGQTGSGGNITTTSSAGAYYVQVGAFGNPAGFDTSKASQLGPVVQRARGNLTLMLIGGFATAADARRVQGRARGMGYNGAFVVQDVGGTLQKLSN
ncbi:MAG: carboxypeptidase regulatory-like domain-containing protein [Bacteroidota bacterium]